LSSFGNILEIACDCSFILKINCFLIKVQKVVLKMVLVLQMQQKSPLSMSAARVFVKRGTILKSAKLKEISNSFIKIISFVPSSLASEVQTIQIDRTAGLSHCHLTKTSLQPTAELGIAHH